MGKLGILTALLLLSVGVMEGRRETEGIRFHSQKKVRLCQNRFVAAVKLICMQASIQDSKYSRELPDLTAMTSSKSSSDCCTIGCTEQELLQFCPLRRDVPPKREPTTTQPPKSFLYPFLVGILASALPKKATNPKNESKDLTAQLEIDLALPNPVNSCPAQCSCKCQREDEEEDLPDKVSQERQDNDGGFGTRQLPLHQTYVRNVGGRSRGNRYDDPDESYSLPPSNTGQTMDGFREPS